jgi:hypothetical protein
MYQRMLIANDPYRAKSGLRTMCPAAPRKMAKAALPQGAAARLFGFAKFAAPGNWLMPYSKNGGDKEPDQPVCQDEKKARKENHKKNESGRDERLAPRWPGHFARLAADLL